MCFHRLENMLVRAAFGIGNIKSFDNAEKNIIGQLA
jgi:hypothetical protein